MAVDVPVLREVVERVCTRNDVLPACKRRDLGSSFFCALVSFTWLPFSSPPAWAIQFRRHDSLMPRSFAIWTIGAGP